MPTPREYPRIKHKREEICIVSEVDTPIALADAHPQCNVGNEPASKAHGHEPCHGLAVWAIRTHDGAGDSPKGICPSVLLVCEDHLDTLREAAQYNLSRAGRRGATIRCATCDVVARTVEDVLWGAERIRS
ncbi:hypothetical protein ACX80U_12210 [Arthrobacter sp. TmT3-37]